MDKQKNLKPIEKMNQKELKEMCKEQRDQLKIQENKIESLNKIIERMTNERTFEEDMAEKGRKEAANLRTRAISQADEIIADAREAAEKIIECARTSVYESQPENIVLPGADNLDLSGLLSNTSTEVQIEPENPPIEEEVAEIAQETDTIQETEISTHERILADYF